MRVNLTYRVTQANAIRDILQSGGTFQLGGGAIPASIDTALAVVIADGTVSGGNVTVNQATALLTISGLSDTIINVSGTPTSLRINDDSGLRAEFTAKMAADATAGIEVVVTDSADAAATGLLANRPFSGSITIQF